MDLVILATPFAVVALVNLLKNFGVVGKWSLLAATLLGVVVQAADYAFLTPEPLTAAGWYAAIATGLILGLTAAGLYDVAQKVGSPPTKATVKVDPVLYEAPDGTVRSVYAAQHSTSQDN